MDPTVQSINKDFIEYVGSNDRGLIKKAEDNISSYTRRDMRESGIARRVLPPIAISSEDLTQDITDSPMRIVEMEPGSQGAISVGYGTTPNTREIMGRRYRVMFYRIRSPRFVKDIAKLGTYRMDIRQVVSDNATADMLAEEDTRFIYAVNGLLGSASGTVSETGTIQWRIFAGGLKRDSMAEGLKIMNRTPSRLEPETILTSQVTAKDILKWDRASVGGDLAQEFLIKGFSEDEIHGRNFITSIKQHLLPEGTVFYFASPKALGKFFVLEDATMHIRNEEQQISFCLTECIGSSIGNVAGVARADYGVYTSA
jgi:hypothetical protein